VEVAQVPPLRGILTTLINIVLKDLMSVFSIFPINRLVGVTIILKFAAFFTKFRSL